MDYQFFINSFNDFPVLVKTAWILSGLFIFIVTCLTIYLKIIRSYLRKRDIKIIKFKNEYEALIVEFLFLSSASKSICEEQQSIILKIKNAVKNKFERKIVISILYKLMNEVSGEMAESIKILYYNTGLIDHATSKLKNKNWYVIAKGIGELTRFNIKEVHDAVIKFKFHPKREVRKEAHIYLVNMFRFKGLSFLDDIKTPLSEWDQIQLIEVLQKFDDQQICDIKPWLKSPNDTVVLFALKLAMIYNQYEVKDILMDLLSHANKKVRVNVIEVLTYLYGIEAKDKLKANFNAISIEEQICFFEMLEKLVVPSDEPFIEKHLFHKDFEIQLLALKILKSINIDKFMSLNNLPTHEKSQAMLKFENTI